MQTKKKGTHTPPADDRRRGKRHLACFPAYIEPEGGAPRSAIIRDLSVTGTMLLTRANVVIGEHVALSLYITDDPNHPGSAFGTVVRLEPWGDGNGLWKHSVAIEFDEPASEYEHQIQALAEKQAKLGLFKR